MTEITCDEEACRWNKEIKSAWDGKIVRLCHKDFISVDSGGCTDYEEE